MNAFKTLNLFLESCGLEEVEGRALEILPEQVLRQLKAFATGTLSPEGRLEVIALLKKHPTWVSHLAHQVKLLRHDQPADPETP